MFSLLIAFFVRNCIFAALSKILWCVYVEGKMDKEELRSLRKANKLAVKAASVEKRKVKIKKKDKARKVKK